MNRNEREEPMTTTTEPIKLYKVLKGGKSSHGGTLTWSLPKGKKPGDWHEVSGDLVKCGRGLHLTPNPAAWWLSGGAAYLVEAEGVEGDPRVDTKVVAHRVRLLRRLTADELEVFGIERAGAGTKEKVYPKESTVYRLLSLTWDSTPGGSWQRLNSAMGSALRLAIDAGFAFNPGDVALIMRKFNAVYWIGDLESRYANAVDAGNISACHAFESYLNRGPFIWEGSRLCIGARLPWASDDTTVTSFAPGGLALIACSYKETKRGESRKINKRYTISIDDLRAAEKARKEEERAKRDGEEVVKELGRANVRVPLLVAIRLWTAEERSKARTWASNRRSGAEKKPAPECVARGMKWQAEVDAAYEAWVKAGRKGALASHLPKGSPLRALAKETP